MNEPTNATGSGLEGENQPGNCGSRGSSSTGDKWERTAEEILAESSFDEELGKQMSRDAIRASRGEMSDEEFYEKYHDDVLAEFGVDERPLHEEESHD